MQRPSFVLHNMQRIVLVVLVLVCAACAPARRGAPAAGTPVVFEPSQASKRARGRETLNPELPPEPLRQQASEAQASAQLARAEGLVAQTRKLLPGWIAGDAELAAARAALRVKNWDQAMFAANNAAARADAAQSDHYARLANAALAATYRFTGLDDAQIVQLRAAEEILVTGNSRLAHSRLQSLNAQLEKKIRVHVVESGESLSIIAKQPEVYANPWLWPLIWQANVNVIPDPNRLRAGQVLRLRPNPTIDEVAEALKVARRDARARSRITPSIGQIREVPKSSP
ncbi:MAG: LysM peptidoglycan-binding domain-containing protein [Panacagrimonas sp.]